MATSTTPTCYVRRLQRRCACVFCITSCLIATAGATPQQSTAAASDKPVTTPQTKPVAASTGIVSDVTGSVNVTLDSPHPDKPHPVKAGVNTRVGPNDIVVVGSQSSAILSLDSNGARYRLAENSRVRISNDGTKLRLLSGPLPHRLPESEDRNRRSVLAALLDGRVQATVARGDTGRDKQSAPRNLSPLYGVVPDTTGDWTLKWDGTVAPALVNAAQFRVRIRQTNTTPIVFSATLPASARSVTIAARALQPSTWYEVKVDLMVEHSDTFLHRTTGLVRLLTQEEITTLHANLDAAEAAGPRKELLRARAYETAGRAVEAAAAYEAARHSVGLTAAELDEVDYETTFLKQFLTGG